MADWRPKLANCFSNGSHSAYIAQKRAFENATGDKRIAAVDRFAELRFWFDGLALDLVGRCPPGMAPEKAIERAWKRLDEHFGGRIVTPEESLREVLKTGVIGKDDADAHVILAMKLEQEHDEAVALNCASAFDEVHVIARLVNAKVPHMHEEYWGRLARGEKAPSFTGLIEEIRIRAKMLKWKTIYEPFSGLTPGEEPEGDECDQTAALTTSDVPATPATATKKGNRGSGQQVRRLME